VASAAPAIKTPAPRPRGLKQLTVRSIQASTAVYLPALD